MGKRDLNGNSLGLAATATDWCMIDEELVFTGRMIEWTMSFWKNERARVALFSFMLLDAVRLSANGALADCEATDQS
eukprot:7251682-Heterocapsa_arctica.AAC.1